MTDTIEIETELGRFRGARVGDVSRVHRIPYAAPATGDYRFSLPGSAEPWIGIRGRDPEEPGSAAAAFATRRRPRRLLRLAGRGLPPSRHLGPRRRAGRPRAGLCSRRRLHDRRRSTPCYDGVSLAASTGHLVVDVGYRLGALGFLPIPGVAPPNLGLADQIAAFRWIRRSIKAFGGDPARVTAIGQSAGARTVATLMATPLGRELFDRAS